MKERKKKINSIVYLVLLALGVFSISCDSHSIDDKENSPVDFVNPYMGNISHLLVPTFPTIHLPNSMLRVYPERRDYTGVELNGLPLVVTSHRGSSAFNLSPFQGGEDDLKPVIQYSYDQEKITPYSYSVFLDEQQIQVDYALSHQSAVYELEFEQDKPIHLILNSKKGKVIWDGHAFSGYQLIENNTKVYLYLVPDVLPQQVSTFKDETLITANTAEGRNACLVFEYPPDVKKINLKYGISFIDEIQARDNMEREISGKNLAILQSEGRDIWNKALSKIKIEGGTNDQQTIFYTSMYRCFERPVCISEGGRYYSAFDGAVHDDKGRPFYTDDWIWDSYRAQHPLRILVDPEREEDILHSFLLMAEQMEHFWMPTFPEVTGDSRRMNSNHAVASFIDAHRKGLDNFSLAQAYAAAKGAITEKTLAPWSGLPAGELDRFYEENGYIPALRQNEKETIPEVHPFESRQPVAVTLGTSYDHWCLAQLAQELGMRDEADSFHVTSLNYRHLFNEKTHFFHPKDSKGEFIEPFDYRWSGGMGARKYYGENNGWIYRWDVPHNIPDLISLMGGNERFVENLDATFTEPLGRSKYAFYAQLPDHTGNVGQFSMANEPSLHVPYLYNYAGQPWKTQKRIRKLMEEWFRNDLMGVPGDEDGGGMSSFVVFSAMGFYPVTPGQPVYTIGSPIFEHVSLALGNGKTFEIKAIDVSDDNKYIQSATLNGEKLEQPWFTHETIMNGGELVLEMGAKANKAWGIK
ncbi:glycoside hydrolase family 92 protein [Maribellus luteus]|uniref:Glycoside hydrolase family 92 protein n=1 Tax=Maribellus luteus TaxID=2305463 RepID=A0A399SWR4_9BACT|nr:GH92 family glycosyl hydrolase [Maribellus luteus]RIJ46457.1 glycoside hydrolase family 92 protein [Maribellus luteus]